MTKLVRNWPEIQTKSSLFVQACWDVPILPPSAHIFCEADSQYTQKVMFISLCNLIARSQSHQESEGERSLKFHLEQNSRPAKHISLNWSAPPESVPCASQEPGGGEWHWYCAVTIEFTRDNKWSEPPRDRLVPSLSPKWGLKWLQHQKQVNSPQSSLMIMGEKSHTG